MLKAQDIVVLLKLPGNGEEWTFERLAEELSMSLSAVHRSLRRADEAGLYDQRRRRVNGPGLLEFLAHGMKYLFPATLKGEARGIPTAWAAPPLAGMISAGDRNVPVWPDPKGSVRGIAVEPLHPIVAEAATRDSALGEKLALVDALRLGSARERALAEKELAKRLLDDGPRR
jgi:hypothetical protein